MTQDTQQIAPIKENKKTWILTTHTKKQNYNGNLREPTNFDNIQNLSDKNEWLKSLNENKKTWKHYKFSNPLIKYQKRQILPPQNGSSSIRKTQEEKW